MKKTLRLLFTLLLTVVVGSAWADDVVTYTLDGTQTNTDSENSNYAKESSITQSEITWKVTGNTTMNPWRIGGKSLTSQDRPAYSQTAIADNVTKIEVAHGTRNLTVNSFKLDVYSTAELAAAGATGDVSSLTADAFAASSTTTFTRPDGADWTGRFYRFTWNVTTSGSKNQFTQLSSIKFYKNDGGVTVTAPTISGTTPFSGSTEVTITVPDGTTVYYTTDGNDPDDREGTEYTAPFTISATTTVKAIAYDSKANGSSIASKVFVKTEHAGTQADPYTVADVLAIYDGGSLPSDNVYVKGIISQIDNVSTSYGNATYYISDDGTTTKQYEIFRGKWLNNTNFSSADQIAVGGTVVVCGQLVLYNNTTKEMTQGNYIVEYTVPDFAQPTISGETSFLESTTVTITADGATSIRYTTDGTDPTSTTGTVYSEPFSLTATSTVKAIAIYSTGESSVASQTFTKTKTYTVSEAIAELTAGTQTTDAVAITGIVSQIDELSTKYGNATYYISDDGTTTSQLQVFRGKDFANAKFSNAYALEVGDKVTIIGVLTNYTNTKTSTTTQEITSSYIVKLATPITIGETGYATAYYSGKNFTIPTGVTATTYKVADGTNTLVGTAHAAGEVIPAGEAVVLSGAAAKYDFNVVASTTTTADADNELLGTDTETALTADATKYFYELSLNANKEAGSVGFYWANDDGSAFTNGAHKAYLTRTKDTTAAKISAYLLNGGTVTGINDINAEEKAYDGAIYNVAGQRVNKDYKGVVIINGKKIIKK